MARETLLLADDGFIDLALETRSLLKKRTLFDDKGITWGRFKNGEVRVRVNANVRGKDVVLFKSFLTKVQESLVYEPNEAYLELFLANDALKHAGARRIINVVPYLPYLRQDRVATKGDPVSAKFFAEMTYRSGANLIITVDVHAPTILPLYPKSKITGTETLFADYIRNHAYDTRNCLLVAPDSGAKVRVAKIAKLISAPMAVCEKKRDKDGKLVSLGCPTVPKGRKHAIIYDDMIDSGGTLFRTVDALQKKGVTEFTFCCTHAILSGNAKEELTQRGITLVTTNSIPRRQGGVTTLSLSKPIAEALDTVIV